MMGVTGEGEYILTDKSSPKWPSQIICALSLQAGHRHMTESARSQNRIKIPS